MDKELFDKMKSIQGHLQRKTKNANKENKDKRALIDNSVTKSNALARAYYRYNIVEKRIMESLISRLHPLRGDNEYQDIDLTAKDYSEAFGVPLKIAYRELERGVTGLTNHVINIEGKGVKGRFKYPLMSMANYLDDEGRIVCSFNSRLVPHLVGMREKFRSYMLKDAAGFSSSYTWRMYELLLSWSQPKSETDGLLMGWIEIEVVEIRKILGVPEVYQFSDFRRQVLDTATKELKEKAFIEMLVERKKTGRKVTHLNIQFIEDKKAKDKRMYGNET